MSLNLPQPITPHDGFVRVIDQTRLPHEVVMVDLRSLDDTADAISSMQVRGAPLIGVTAAYGLAFGMRDDPSNSSLSASVDRLVATRPTGVNLRRAVRSIASKLSAIEPAARAQAAFAAAGALLADDSSTNRLIGTHGLPILASLADGKDGPVQVLTHCNAGVLATTGFGTATAPIYLAHESGIPIHVWVDETRPRNQGAALTAWELGQAGIPHTVIVDNAGGHLMQVGRVDVCLVGTDRTLVSGDVCNKIGTYLKALAAHDNGIPFYAAVPGLSIDWESDEPGSVPIEERDGREVAELGGVRLTPADTPTANFGFDVTPARLVTGLITERGLCAASTEGLRSLYPEIAP